VAAARTASVASGHPNQSLRSNSKLKFETKLLFDCFEHAAALIDLVADSEQDYS
jgi:hypothetical protein